MSGERFKSSNTQHTAQAMPSSTSLEPQRGRLLEIHIQRYTEIFTHTYRDMVRGVYRHHISNQIYAKPLRTECEMMVTKGRRENGWQACPLND